MPERSEGPGVEGLGQIAVTVRDVERAEAFYRDALGLDHLFTATGMSFFRVGDVRLMLAEPESAELDHPSSILYFRVADIHAAREALEGRGVEIVREPRRTHSTEEMDLWMTFFRDGEGNTMALMSEVATG